LFFPAFAGKAVDFGLYMPVHIEGNGVMAAVDNNISGCVDFQDSLGDQEPQVLLLLDQLGFIVRIDIQDQ